MKFRRLFYDIEVSPNIGLFWRTGYKISIPVDNIVVEKKIISVAWKWQGERTVHALHWDKNKCDKTLLKEFVPVLEESDEAVAYYGDSFDFPWIRGRCFIHGVPINHCIRTVDPMKWVTKLGLNSNKMNYVARLKGNREKLEHDYGLWTQVTINGCTKSLDRIVRYNKNDVVMLEDAFDELQPYFPSPTHMGVFEGNDKWTCPRCGIDDTRKTKTRVTAKGTVQHQMQCRQGHFYSIGSVAFKDYERQKDL